jgi:hypothetical protein
MGFGSPIIRKGRRMSRGLALFVKDLHADDVAEIRGWSTRPGLLALLTKLNSMKEREQFLDHYAEAMVALHLIRQACELEYEAPTVNRKSADLKVSKGRNVFFAHIKRVNLSPAMAKDWRIATRLYSLKQIRRPVTVSVTFFRSLTDQEMQYCCKIARGFVEVGNHGDRKEIVNAGDEPLVELEIGPRHTGRHIRLLLVGPGVDGGDESQIRNQLTDAYHQFMPGFENIVLVATFWSDDGGVGDLKEALGEFWTDGNHPLSKAVVYFAFDPKEGTIGFQPFFRDERTLPYIAEVFRTPR